MSGARLSHSHFNRMINSVVTYFQQTTCYIRVYSFLFAGSPQTRAMSQQQPWALPPEMQEMVLPSVVVSSTGFYWPTSFQRCPCIPHQELPEWRDGTWEGKQVRDNLSIALKNLGCSRGGQPTWRSRVLWDSHAGSLQAALQQQGCGILLSQLQGEADQPGPLGSGSLGHPGSQQLIQTNPRLGAAAGLLLGTVPAAISRASPPSAPRGCQQHPMSLSHEGFHTRPPESPNWLRHMQRASLNYSSHP